MHTTLNCPKCNLVIKTKDNTIWFPYNAINILVSLATTSVSRTTPHKFCCLVSQITLFQNVVNPRSIVLGKLAVSKQAKVFPVILGGGGDRVENSPHIFSILTQMNQVYMLKFYAFKIHFNTILPSMPRSSKWSQIKRCRYFFSPQNTCHLLRPTHHP